MFYSPNNFLNTDDNFYLDKFKAPYAFYANYDIEKYDIDKIESYELSSIMFKEAGLKYGPMERFNTYGTVIFVAIIGIYGFNYFEIKK